MNNLHFAFVALAFLLSATVSGAQLLPSALYEWTGQSLSGQNMPKVVQASQADGSLGRAPELQFDGGEFIQAKLKAATLEEMTLAFFLRSERRTPEGLFSFFTSARTSTPQFSVALYDTIRVMQYDSQGKVASTLVVVTNPPMLPAQEWVHVAVTFNRGAVSVYQDGVRVASRRFPAGQIRLGGDSQFLIGTITQDLKKPPVAFQGRMAGIVLLPRVLSEDEIFALMVEVNP